MSVGRALTGLGTGALFGLGLCVSQMVNPEKVLAFLNVAANWDPSLLLVMGAALTVSFFGFRWATGSTPVFETDHSLPTNTLIDRKLVTGAIIFGIGWGLAGYCPGPAITGLGTGLPEPLLFVLAMLAGSQIARFVEKAGATPASH